MQSTQVKYIFSNPSFLSNSIRKTSDFPSTDLAFSKNAVSLFQFRPIAASARKKKRASGSIRSTKIMLESAYLIATKLKILPEPLDTILREFGGGIGNGGGGFTFWRGHGWGGFDGWRRRQKINWGFWVLFLGAAGGLWLILGKELEIDVFFGVLGLTLFGFSVNVWKRGALDWVLGFCCCAALVGGFMRKEDLQRLFGTIKIGRRRRKRRPF